MLGLKRLSLKKHYQLAEIHHLVLNMQLSLQGWGEIGSAGDVIFFFPKKKPMELCSLLK